MQREGLPGASMDAGVSGAPGRPIGKREGGVGIKTPSTPAGAGPEDTWARLLRLPSMSSRVLCAGAALRGPATWASSAVLGKMGQEGQTEAGPVGTDRSSRWTSRVLVCARRAWMS